MYRLQQHEFDARSRSRALLLDKNQELTLAVDPESSHNFYTKIAHYKVSHFTIHDCIAHRDKLYYTIFKHKIKAKQLIVKIDSLFTRKLSVLSCIMAKNCKQIQLEVWDTGSFKLMSSFLQRIFRQRKPSYQGAFVKVITNAVPISSQSLRELSRGILSRKITECAFSLFESRDIIPFTKFIGVIRGIQRLKALYISFSDIDSELELSHSLTLLMQSKLLAIENLNLRFCKILTSEKRFLISKMFWSSLSCVTSLRYLNLAFNDSSDTFYKEGALLKSLNSLQQLEMLDWGATYEFSITKDFAVGLGGLAHLVPRVKEFKFILHILGIESEDHLIELFSALGLNGLGVLKKSSQWNEDLEGHLILEVGCRKGNLFLKKIEAQSFTKKRILQRIVVKLCQVAPELEHFEFYRNRNIDLEVSNEFLLSLAKSLLSPNKLQNLKLGLIATSQETQTNLITLLEAIKLNKSLVHLYLSLTSKWDDPTGLLLLKQMTGTLEHLTNLRSLTIEADSPLTIETDIPLSKEPFDLTWIAQTIKSFNNLESFKLTVQTMKVDEKQFIGLIMSICQHLKLLELRLEMEMRDINKIEDHLPSVVNCIKKMSVVELKIWTRRYLGFERLRESIKTAHLGAETVNVFLKRNATTTERLKAIGRGELILYSQYFVN